MQPKQLRVENSIVRQRSKKGIQRGGRGMGKRECDANIMMEAETNDKDSHSSSTGSLNPFLKMEYVYRRDTKMNAKEGAEIICGEAATRGKKCRHT